MKKFVMVNFHIAVWASIAAGLGLFVEPSVIVPQDTDGGDYLRNTMTTVAASIALLQLALWFTLYIKRRGQIGAFLVGALGVLLGQYIDEHRGADLILTMRNLEHLANFAYYVGFSHLLYVVATVESLRELFLLLFKR
jgi:hypothetical protein